MWWHENTENYRMFSPLEYQEIQKETIEQATKLVDYKIVQKQRPRTFEEYCKGTTFIQFLGTHHYTKAIMEDVIASVCSYETHLNVNFNATVASNFPALKNTLDEKISNNSFLKPHYIFFYDSMKTKIWTMTAIVEHEDVTYALHRHPNGKDMDADLKTIFESLFPKISDKNYLYNKNDALGDDGDVYFSGPLAIRSMVKINYEHENKPLKPKMISGFKDLNIFPTADMVKEEKLELAKGKAECIATAKEAFLRTVLYHKFTFDELMKMDFTEIFRNYAKELFKTKFTNVEPTREKFYIFERLSGIESDLRRLVKIQKKGELKLDIHKDYAKETASLTCLFLIMCGCNFDDNRAMVMHQITSLFRIPKSIDEFYNKFNLEKPKENGPTGRLEVVLDRTAVMGITTLPKEIKGDIQIVSEISYDDIKEISLETGWPQFYYEEYYKNNSKALQLLEYFNEYTKIAKKLRLMTAQKVHDRAVELRTHLGNDIDVISEAIVLVNRAMELKTRNVLRKVQVYTLIIIFVCCPEERAKFIQVLTGEGKTMIISLVALILVLQGHKVDVITTNSYLANEAATGMYEYANLLGITVGQADDIEVLYNRDGYMEEYTERIKQEIGVNQTTDGPRFWQHKQTKYMQDIIFGTLKKFQFDYIYDRMRGDKKRRGRPYDYLIIDEVDDITLDNGNRVARIAESYPGMFNLRYVYINIWKALNKATEENKNKYIELCKNRLIELKNQQLNVADFDKQYRKYVQETARGLESVVQQIKDTNPTDLPFLPAHIKQYADEALDKLITSAFYAKFVYVEGLHYKLDWFMADDREYRVVPIDFQNSGIAMSDTVWGRGLHQFIELKHNLHVTFEMLTSTYVSTVSYIKLYGDGQKLRVIGLSGTIGGYDEKKFLQEIYGPCYFYGIPRFENRIFVELKKESTFVEDEYWQHVVAVDTIYRLRKHHAVMVVCNSLKDVDLLKTKLEYIKNNVDRFKYEYLSLTTCTDTEQLKDFTNVDTQRIYLTTTIAGRGLNIKASDSLNKIGGLHITIGFLPANDRVQQQIFGRTGRFGSRGTGCIIGRMGETAGMDVPGMAVDHAINARYERERDRLELVKQQIQQELSYKDKLALKFADFYHHRRAELFFDPSDLFLLKDIKEHWCLWLEMRTEDSDQNKNIDEVFAEFTDRLTFNTLDDLDMVRPRNVYYDILKIDYLRGNGEFDRVKKMLDAMNKPEYEARNSVFAFYLNRFEMAMESGHTLYYKLREVLMDNVKLEEIPVNVNYKQEAIEELKKARKVLNPEIDHLKNVLSVKPENGARYLFDYNQPYIHKSLLFRHLLTRLNCLCIFINNIDQLISYVTTHENEQVYLISRIRAYTQRTDALEGKDESDLCNGETHLGATRREFGEDDGICTVFAANVLPSDVKLKPWFEVLMGCGIAIGLLGSLFVWMKEYTNPIANQLIREAFTDFFIGLMEGDDLPKDTRNAFEQEIHRHTLFNAEDVWKDWYSAEEIITQGLLMKGLRSVGAVKQILGSFRNKVGQVDKDNYIDYNEFGIKVALPMELLRPAELKLPPLLKGYDCVTGVGKTIEHKLSAKSEEWGKPKSLFEVIRDEVHVIDYYLKTYTMAYIRGDSLYDVLQRMTMEEFHVAAGQWENDKMNTDLREIVYKICCIFDARYRNKVAVCGFEWEPLNLLENLPFMSEFCANFCKFIIDRFVKNHRLYDADPTRPTARKILHESSDHMVNAVFRRMHIYLVELHPEPDDPRQSTIFLIKASDAYINQIHTQVLRGTRGKPIHCGMGGLDKVQMEKLFLLLFMRLQTDVAVPKETDPPDVRNDIVDIYDRRLDMFNEMLVDYGHKSSRRYED